MAAASFDGTISIWLINDDIFDCVNTIEGHESEVKSVEFHSNRNWIATCGRDKTVWVWDFDEDFEFSCISIINAHSQDVKKIKWVPNSDLLASASYDETIRI